MLYCCHYFCWYCTMGTISAHFWRYAQATIQMTKQHVGLSSWVHFIFKCLKQWVHFSVKCVELKQHGSAVQGGHSKEVPGSIPGSGEKPFCAEFVCSPPCTCGFPQCPPVFSHSLKGTHVRLICLHWPWAWMVFFCFVFLCGPVIDWCLSPDDC